MRALLVALLLVAGTAQAQQQSGGYPPPAQPNLLLNGDFFWDQRQAGALIATNNVYTVDGWKQSFAGAYSAGGSQQQTADGPPNFTSSIKITDTTGSATLAATDLAALIQFVPGTLMVPYAEGTATAQPIAVSLYVKTSLSGANIWSVGVENAAQNRNWIHECPTAAAGTWTYCSFIIAPDTSGTWVTTSARSLRLNLVAACGSNFQGATDSWVSSGLCSANQTTGWQTTSAATVQFGAVKIEPVQVTPWCTDRASELIRIKQFFQKTFALATKPAQNSTKVGALCTVASVTTAATFGVDWQFNPPMWPSANPTITTYNPSASNANWRSYNATPLDITVSVDAQSALSPNSVWIGTVTTATTAAGDVMCIQATADTNF